MEFEEENTYPNPSEETVTMKKHQVHRKHLQ